MSALLLDNAYLLILAVGMTFVIVTGGIDLSVGSVMAFTGILCAHLLGGRPLGGGRRAGDHPRRRRDRPAHRRARAVLRRPAVHRVAGGALPRPRPGVRREPVVDPGRERVGPVAADDPVPVGRVVHHADRHHGSPRRCDRRLRHAVHPLRAHHLRRRRQRAVGPADGAQRRAHQGARLRHQRRVRRPRRTGADGVLRCRLPAQRHRHRAGRDRRGRHRRHAADRRHGIRARVGDRRVRLRHHQDGHLVPWAPSSPGRGSSSA